MVKKRKSIKTLFTVLLTVIAFCISAFSVSAYYSIYDAYDETTLRYAVKHATNGDYIRINNDITLHGDLCVTKSITLDLTSHTIVFKNSNNGLYIDLASYQSVLVQNGLIYGANGHDYSFKNNGGRAITINGGTTTILNTSLFGGNGGNAKFFPSAGSVALMVKYGSAYLDFVYVKGGNAGTNSSGILGQAGYAVYGINNIFSVGKGWTFNNGSGTL